MKLDQQQQAQHLYFQTDLSKTQIAEHIGVSRRSLHYWIKQNQWERIKQNAEHIPSVLAENCYQLIGGLTAEILSPERAGKPVTSQEASAIYKLTLTINKLKNRGTLNENMELFGWFLDDMAAKDPDLAAKVAPHVSSYIHNRTNAGNRHYKEAMSVRNTSLSFGEGRGDANKHEDELDLLDELTWLQEQHTGQPQPSTTSEPHSAPRTSAPISQPLPKQTQSPASPQPRPTEFVNPKQSGVPQQLHNPGLKQTTVSSPPSNPIRQPAVA